MALDPQTSTPEQIQEYAARDGFSIGFSEDRNKRCRKTMEVWIVARSLS
jgi:hypothetical protein